MNYQNPFLNPYGFGQQMPGQYMQPRIQQQPAQLPPQQVVRVNGENGARTFQIGANSSALLLDESGAIVWLVTSDGAGYKTVSAYDIMPHKEAPAPDYALQLQAATANVLRFPNAWTFNGGVFPPAAAAA